MPKIRKIILIVDDDLAFSDNLKTNLKELAFEILQTDNVDDARVLIHKHQPDGIVLDMQLNYSLGMELVPELLNRDFYFIVVSGYTIPRIRKILEEHRILYYDKNDPRFHPGIIAKAFSILNFSIKREDTIKCDQTFDTTKEFPDRDALESIIRQKLKPYKINVKKKAYGRLVKGISYTFSPTDNQDNSLASIYIDVLNEDYRAAFVSIRRLLDETAELYPNIFCQTQTQKIEKEVPLLDSKGTPTPSDFIHYIVSQIHDDFEKHKNSDNEI